MEQRSQMLRQMRLSVRDVIGAATAVRWAGLRLSAGGGAVTSFSGAARKLRPIAERRRGGGDGRGERGQSDGAVSVSRNGGDGGDWERR